MNTFCNKADEFIWCPPRKLFTAKTTILRVLNLLGEIPYVYDFTFQYCLSEKRSSRGIVGLTAAE